MQFVSFVPMFGMLLEFNGKIVTVSVFVIACKLLV